MKKTLLYIILFALSVFGLPQMVLAKEKLYEVNLYEYDDLVEISEQDLLVLSAALRFNNDLFHYDCSDISCNFYYHDVLFLTETECSDDNCGYPLYLDSFTEDDDLEYIFTEDNKNSLQNEFTFLQEYDGLLIHFSNSPGIKEFIIKSIIFVEASGNAFSKEEPSFDNLNIHFDLRFSSVGDSIIYEVVLKNSTDNDYYILNDSVQNDYINTSLSFEDGSNYIQSHTKKSVLITITYNTEVPLDLVDSGYYHLSKEMPINFSTSDPNKPSMTNPGTYNNIMIVVFVLLVVSLLVLFRKNKKIISIIIILLVLIPLSAKSEEGARITIDLDAEIKINRTFTFEPDYPIFNSHLSEPRDFEYGKSMTWREFLESDYSEGIFHYNEVKEFIYSDSYGISCAPDYWNFEVVFNSNHTPVQLDDLIENGVYYSSWKYYSDNRNGEYGELTDGSIWC